jgi:hypothetical protein
VSATRCALSPSRCPTPKRRARCGIPRSTRGLNTLGATPVRFSGGSEIQVATRTIDGVYAATRVDVIKVDTEGWEYFILLGGRAVLRRDRPELLLEVNDENMRQCGVTRGALLALLAELGYAHVATIDGENMAFSAR